MPFRVKMQCRSPRSLLYLHMTGPCSQRLSSNTFFARNLNITSKKLTNGMWPHVALILSQEILSVKATNCCLFRSTILSIPIQLEVLICAIVCNSCEELFRFYIFYPHIALINFEGSLVSKKRNRAPSKALDMPNCAPISSWIGDPSLCSLCWRFRF